MGGLSGHVCSRSSLPEVARLNARLPVAGWLVSGGLKRTDGNEGSLSHITYGRYGQGVDCLFASANVANVLLYGHLSLCARPDNSGPARRWLQALRQRSVGGWALWVTGNLLYLLRVSGDTARWER